MKTELFSLNAYLAADNPKKEVKAYWQRLVGFLADARSLSPLLQQWYLQASNRPRALRFHVLENEKQCLEELQKKKEIRSANQNELIGYFFGLWNGSEDTDRGLSLTAALGWREKNFLSLSLPYQYSSVSETLFDIEKLLELLRLAEHWWRPSWVAVISSEYQKEHALFKDRRGVGWLAYVGEHVEKRAIPEAAGMVHFGRGTAVVTTYDLFSSANLQHVEKANRIEARLADLGLLPKM